MSGVSAIVAMTPPHETAPAAETKILTASTVELELPAVAETTLPRAPVELPPAMILAGEMVREETVVPAPVEEAAAAAKPEALLKLDWQTDLTQIETNPTKQRERAQKVEDEAPPPRPKRVRTPLATFDEGPLVQIETQRENAAVAAQAPAVPAPASPPPASHPL
jgi:hypothetical protein